MSNEVFNPNVRAGIETIVENYLQYAKPLMNVYKYPEPKKSLKYENERDFVIGFLLGGMQATVKDSFMVTYNRQLTSEEEQELAHILWHRMTRIRSDLFDTT